MVVDQTGRPQGAPLRHLVERFRETYRIHALRPHPEERVFARRARARVSKDGSLHRRLRPSFETHRLRDAPQDEVRGGCRYDKDFGNEVGATLVVALFRRPYPAVLGNAQAIIRRGEPVQR
jgi:hypothetical protein